MSQAIHPLVPVYPKYPTILHALARAVDLRPDEPAIVCQDRELTFRTYAQAVAALAERFKAVGAARGERIAFVIGNSLEACVGLLAGMAAGAQVSPLNPNYTDVELETLLRDVEPCVLVCDAAAFEKSRCSPSAPLGQTEGLSEGRISGSS